MKALAKVRAAPGLELIDIETPKPKRDEVLVRVALTGICGTDLHLEAWDDWAAATSRPGIVLGHEFSGRVIAAGGPSGKDLVGEHATAEGHLPCLICEPCVRQNAHLCVQNRSVGVTSNGVFSEYIVVPISALRVVGESVGPQAAALLDPLGNVVHALDGISPAGKSVIVTGAGPLGLLAVALLGHLGAARIAITDLNPGRLRLAETLGATETYLASQLPSDLRSFDFGLEMSGAPGGLAALVRLVRPGGEVRLLGLPQGLVPVDIGTVISKMLTVRGIYGRQMRDTWEQVAETVSNGFAPEKIVTSVYPARDWGGAFIAARTGSSGKILMDWGPFRGTF